MAIIDLVPKVRAVQFTGGNAAEVLTLAQEITGVNPYHTAEINGDSDSSICIIDYKNESEEIVDSSAVINGSYWVNVGPSFQSLNQSELDARHRVSSVAFGTDPSIVVNGLSNANFDIDIFPPKVGTEYTAVACLTGGASLLGSLSITASTLNADGTLKAAQRLSGSQVRVNVTNSGALQLSGAAILVFAY